MYDYLNGTIINEAHASKIQDFLAIQTRETLINTLKEDTREGLTEEEQKEFEEMGIDKLREMGFIYIDWLKNTEFMEFLFTECFQEKD